MLRAVFDDATQYQYNPGSIFFGKCGDDHAVGLETYRHLITIAGTQSGKGATLIVPNLRRWPHNVFGFDPKGENISLSWQQREALGQRVAAFDPYSVANVPDRLRATFNPLGDLDPEDPFTPSVIESLAEGLTIRYKADDAMWDNGGRTVVSGFIAFCVLAADEHEKNLPAVAAQMRKAFRDPTIYDLMADIDHPLLGGLIREAAIIGISSAGGNRQSESYVRSALDQTKWLVTDEALGAWLSSSGVSLRDLKDGKLSFFVCLPFDKSAVRPELLKLLLQYAMSVMQRDLVQGSHSSRCLFLLDEAYCMGRVPDILRNMAGLTAYGVQIWTIWQNIGQLHELYKSEGAAQFFSAADAAMFFGMGEFDDASPRLVAEAIGRIEVRDIDVKLPVRQFPNVPPDVWAKAHINPVPPAPRQPTPQFTNGNGGRSVSAFGDMMASTSHDLAYARYQSEVVEQGLAQMHLALARESAEIESHRQTTAYNHAMSQRGDYKVPPREVRRITAKAGPKLPARNMIVFTGRGDNILVELLPHWEQQVSTPRVVQLKNRMASLRTEITSLQSEKDKVIGEEKKLQGSIDQHAKTYGADYRARLPDKAIRNLFILLGLYVASMPIASEISHIRICRDPRPFIEHFGPPLIATAIAAPLMYLLVVWFGAWVQEKLCSALKFHRRCARDSLKMQQLKWRHRAEDATTQIRTNQKALADYEVRYQPIKHETV